MNRLQKYEQALKANDVDTHIHDKIQTDIEEERQLFFRLLW